MVQLEEVVKEGVGKSSFEMRSFFQEMVRKGQLKAFSVEVNKQRVLSDTRDKKVVKTKKGATLTPTKELKEYQPVILKDPKTRVMYFLYIGSRGGEFYNDGDSQTIYYHCVLEMLSKNFNPKDVTKSDGMDKRISIPTEIVTARLRINYNEDCDGSGETDKITGTNGSIAIEGKQDSLFQRVYEFVRKQNSQ